MTDLPETAPGLMDFLRLRGATLSAAETDGNIAYSGPGGLLTDELRATIRAMKPQLLVLIGERSPEERRAEFYRFLYDRGRLNEDYRPAKKAVPFAGGDTDAS